MAKKLLEEGATVLGIDTRTSRNKRDKRSIFIQGDIASGLKRIAPYLRTDGKKRKVLIHLAGIANAKICEERPDEAVALNVGLTHRALEFCRVEKIEKFIFPSTGLVYDINKQKSFAESDPAIPRNIYTSTKLASEALVRGYSSSFKFCGIIVRLSNIYGKGISQETVLGTALSKIKRNGEIIVRDMRPVRDFIYIDDVVEGFIRLSSADLVENTIVVNLSTGTGTSVGKLLETVCGIMKIPKRTIKAERNSDASAIVLDNRFLTKITGWSPKYSLFEGLSLQLKRG